MDFNLSFYIKTLQKGLVQHNKQLDAACLLLDPIATREDVNVILLDKKISNIVNRKTDIDDAIKAASAKPEIFKMMLTHFKQKVLPDLNSHLVEDTCQALLHCLSTDINVSSKTFERYQRFFQNEKWCEFLTHGLFYALARPNKREDSQPEENDFPLLEEVDNECPLCHTKLIKVVKGKPKRNYHIIQIFPDGLEGKQKEVFHNLFPKPKKLDTIQNKIALCFNHAENYVEDPEPEEYLELAQLKEKLACDYQAKQTLLQLDLENEISAVIHALQSTTYPEWEELNLTPLEIKQKILPEYALLKNTVQYHVLNYYRFISDLFAKTPDYDLIASSIKKAFRKLEQSHLSQPEIVEHLSHWMVEKTHSPPESLEACRILVSFFIQNCEVFNEIPQ